MEVGRKKSPRAPSITLDEAIARALAAHDKAQTHPVPTEVMAQNLGYKSANNGSALAAIASLRYFGLLDRPKDGTLAVSRAVEAYKLIADEGHRRELLINFLLGPPLFKELLGQYPRALPADATLHDELIHRGFLPGPADACVAVFRKSVAFADYFRTPAVDKGGDLNPSSAQAKGEEIRPGQHPSVSTSDGRLGPAQGATSSGAAAATSVPPCGAAGEGERIPIRLTGGRRAWLIVPDQLFEADKARLKAHIDLLLTVEQDRSLP